jgi:2-iminobutanoate/2-iminopropanoate deaminase
MRIHLPLAVLAAAACTVGGSQSAGKPEAPHYLESMAAAALPLSEAVRVGNMLYLSGQVGVDTAGNLVPGGLEPETRQALNNIRDLLVRNGSSMDRVVKCTVFMADMKEWPAMNAIYAMYFPVHMPARSAFATAGLWHSARLEIECMAAVGA